MVKIASFPVSFYREISSDFTKERVVTSGAAGEHGNLLSVFPPMPHQIECLKNSFGKEGFGFLMDPGTGKTFTALTEAANLYLRKKIDFLLVIAPSGVDDEWLKQAAEHCPVPYVAHLWTNWNTQKAQYAFSKFHKTTNVLRILAVRIDVFSRDTFVTFFKNLIKANKTYLVIDEATIIKNPEAARTDNLLHGINTPLDPAGHEVEIRNNRYISKVATFAPSALYRRVLTGTLVTTSPFNVWAPMYFLRYNYFGLTYNSFKIRYGVMTTDKTPTGKPFLRIFGEKEYSILQSCVKAGETVEEIASRLHTTEETIKHLLANPGQRLPYKRLDELKKFVDNISFTCTLESVVEIPREESYKFVKMGKKQASVYTQVETQSLYTSDESSRALAVTVKIAQAVRLAQIASGFLPTNIDLSGLDFENLSEEEFDAIFERKEKITKLELIDGVPEKIKELVADLEEMSFSRPALVFSRFITEISLLVEEIRKAHPTLRVERYDGTVDEVARNRIKAAFVAGEIDILVNNPAVAGRGLNLQRANKLLYVSSDMSYERRKQSLGRGIRMGQEGTVFIKHYIAEDTVEEGIEELLKDRKELSDFFREKGLKELVKMKLTTS